MELRILLKNDLFVKFLMLIPDKKIKITIINTKASYNKMPKIGIRIIVATILYLITFT